MSLVFASVFASRCPPHCVRAQPRREQYQQIVEVSPWSRPARVSSALRRLQPLLRPTHVKLWVTDIHIKQKTVTRGHVDTDVIETPRTMTCSHSAQALIAMEAKLWMAQRMARMIPLGTSSSVRRFSETLDATTLATRSTVPSNPRLCCIPFRDVQGGAFEEKALPTRLMS